MCLHRIEHIKQKLNKDILRDDDYLEFYNIDKKNMTEIDQMRAESKNISEFLINITNKEKYTPKQIYDNLNNCLYNYKSALFSCGHNVKEHQDKYNQIENSDEFIRCCWKNNIIDNIDIIGIGNNINLTIDYLENNQSFVLCIQPPIISNEIPHFQIKKTTIKFIDKNDALYFDKKHNKTLSPNFMDNDIYIFIVFLRYIGLKEINLFGFYLDNKMLDIRNYNYYDDIICCKFHYYETIDKSRTKEPGVFYDHLNSCSLKNWADSNNTKIYNVSNTGCLSNTIPRITFESIFLNNKTIIEPEYKYEDLSVQMDKYIDKEFYYRKYNKPFTIQDYVESIYYINPINDKDLRKGYQISDLLREIMGVTAYIIKYPGTHNPNIKAINMNLDTVFGCHYLLRFNNAMEICFYKDFDLINSNEYWDEKLIENSNKISIFTNKDIIDLDYPLQIYNESKYFYLLLLKLRFKCIDNLPNDFNAIEYKQLNEDLKHMTDLGTSEHYINQGISEKRRYKCIDNLPNNFNASEYKQLHEDLKHMTDLEASVHYINQGISEKRRYK